MKRGGMSTGYGGKAASGGMRGEDVFESENNQKMENLRSKVALLKDLTIDIGEETRAQNKMLDEMGGDFDSTGGMLGSSMKRLQKLTGASAKGVTCYLVMFVVFVFFVIYYVIR